MDFSELEQIDHWPAGEVLFREGDSPRGVYVIHGGEVELLFSGRNGSQRALRVMREGDVVGLADVISHRNHDCTATTRTSAKLGFIPFLDLARVLNDTPTLWLSVAKILSADVSSCWDSMRHLNA
jgi:CRP-like cAMP-binding protein